jgi:squalene-hopene/tetraprenyl-beta-curcumene cyclase
MNRFGGTATLSSLDQEVNPASKTTLEDGLTAARDALLSLQKQDGHWCFPLEADCTIPAEYVLMMLHG